MKLADAKRGRQILDNSRKGGKIFWIAKNFVASLRGGAKNFGPSIVLDSLGVNKYALKIGENNAICKIYSDFRYFPYPNP